MQAKAIACEMRRRHEEDGIPWHEMAVLLRCFKTTQGVLHSKLQTGQFPDPAQIVEKLRAVMEKEKQQAAAAA